MISALVKKIIEGKLALTLEEIESKGAEKLDEHIEQKIIKDKLTLSESGCRIIHKRGYALGLISIDDINKEIDSFAKL